MKVTNWRKKLAASLVAAGIMVPGVANAATIPVPDADFDTYAVNPAKNYAYANAASPKGPYRTGDPNTASPWVDDLAHNSGSYAQDSGSSNWLYNSTWASANPVYPFPRGGAGDQSMFGLNRYNGQVLSDTYQADTEYTFSVWAQGLAGTPTSTKGRVFLYLFNGDDLSTFSDSAGVALIRQSFRADQGNFQVRASGSSDADSQSNWTKLSASATVPAGSPLIGQHIGVGFFLYPATALDDVTLTAQSTVPEPTTVVLLGLGGVTLLGCGRRRR